MKQASSFFSKNTTAVALAAVVGCLFFTSTTSYAEASNEELEKRLQRLEQIVENRQQLDLVNKVTQLQEAVETLRGEMDVQTRALQELTERQQLYFQDMDQRLVELENIKNDKNIASPIEPLYPSVTPAPVVQPGSSTVTPPITDNKPTIPAPAATPVSPQQDQASYQQAYQYLLDKDYAQAVTGLNQYLQQYPQGTYRANAYYWLGEVYLIKSQPQQAQQAFNTVLNDFPQNSKAGDALLKLGYSYAALGDNAQAKTVFNQVVQQYPNTQLSRIAESRLAELS